MGTTVKKTITKTELACVLNVSKGTLRRYLNTDLYNALEPLGYKKNTNIISGQVFAYIKQHYCLHDDDF